MLIPQKQSITSTIRHLCQQIETQINNLIKKFASNPSAPQRTTPELHKLQQERNFQEMKNSIIQTLTSRLPLLIDYEESMNQQVQDITEERDACMQKCKELTERLEHEQLQNQRLGCELNAITQSYSQLSVNFEELKYKYHELQEKQYENRRNSEHKTYLDKLNDLNLLSKDSGTNSASSQRENSNENIKNTTEMMLYQKEMFLEEIRSSQKEIFAFRTKVQELMEENQRLQKENREFEQLLMGEKQRCDKFDREILEILNKNQQLKLDVLQQKEYALQSHQQTERVNALLQEEQQKVTALRSENEQLKKEVITHKQTINELKTQSSQQREEYSVLEQKQREQRQKIAEMKKENQQLRTQLEKILHKLTQTTDKYQKTKQQEILRYKHQLQEERSKNGIYERQSRSKNQEKVHEISKMHKEITHKLEQKIHLLERGNKEKKEKATQLKYEVERLYESLQIQVQKEFKNAEQIKGLTSKVEEFQKENKSLKENLTKALEVKEHLQETSKKQKFQLFHTEKKLKKITQINTKLVTFTLPKIKEQLHSTRLLCQHFCTMIDMEKQQIGFLLAKKQEHFQQLIEQTLLQKTIHKEQANMTHMAQLNKWKENCKIYEEKYDRLKNTFDHLEEKHQKLEVLYEQETKTYSEQLTALQEEYEKKRAEQASTRKTIEVLKEKCKEVEQYYKLVEDLSKQNMVLKNKLETASYYSFKSPEKNELDNTSKRQKFTSEQQLQKYSKTTNMVRLHSRGDEYNVNDLTAKAEFQRMRLEAAKREYNMLNRPEHQ